VVLLELCLYKVTERLCSPPPGQPTALLFAMVQFVLYHRSIDPSGFGIRFLKRKPHAFRNILYRRLLDEFFQFPSVFSLGESHRHPTRNRQTPIILRTSQLTPGPPPPHPPTSGGPGWPREWIRSSARARRDKKTEQTVQHATQPVHRRRESLLR